MNVGDERAVLGESLLNGIGMQGFRSFYGQMQLFGPLTKVNILAGQNNAGKSNVVRFVKRFLTTGDISVPALDLPNSSERGKGLTMALAIRADDAVINHLIASSNNQGFASEARQVVGRILGSSAMRREGDNLAWIAYHLRDAGDSSWGNWQLDRRQVERIAKEEFRGQDGSLENISNNYFNQSSGNIIDNLQRFVEIVSPLQGQLPQVFVVEAFRQIRVVEGGTSDAIFPNGVTVQLVLVCGACLRSVWRV